VHWPVATIGNAHVAGCQCAISLFKAAALYINTSLPLAVQLPILAPCLTDLVPPGPLLNSPFICHSRYLYENYILKYCPYTAIRKKRGIREMRPASSVKSMLSIELRLEYNEYLANVVLCLVSTASEERNKLTR